VWSVTLLGRAAWSWVAGHERQGQQLVSTYEQEMMRQSRVNEARVRQAMADRTQQIEAGGESKELSAEDAAAAIRQAPADPAAVSRRDSGRGGRSIEQAAGNNEKHH
jgi:hypothetical protein